MLTHINPVIGQGWASWKQYCNFSVAIGNRGGPSRRMIPLECSSTHFAPLPRGCLNSRGACSPFAVAGNSFSLLVCPPTTLTPEPATPAQTGQI